MSNLFLLVYILVLDDDDYDISYMKAKMFTQGTIALPSPMTLRQKIPPPLSSYDMWDNIKKTKYYIFSPD